jgi:excisionase family DNA binding protein
MNMDSINDKWLTIDELVTYLKMGRTKLYTMAQKGFIPGKKIGNQWRFDREEIDEWIKSGRAAESSTLGTRHVHSTSDELGIKV